VPSGAGGTIAPGTGGASGSSSGGNSGAPGVGGSVALGGSTASGGNVARGGSAGTSGAAGQGNSGAAGRASGGAAGGTSPMGGAANRGGASMGGGAAGRTSGGTAGAASGGVGGGMAGAGGNPNGAACKQMESDYAEELATQIVCNPQQGGTRCGGRVAAAPGCDCRIFIDPKDLLAVEHLGNRQEEWFQAGCSMPTCPASCPSGNRGVCQADSSATLGGRCVAAP
jgi:hypothetical protein